MKNVVLSLRVANVFHLFWLRGGRGNEESEFASVRDMEVYGPSAMGEEKLGSICMNWSTSEKVVHRFWDKSWVVVL